jgi:glycosyltransferase involved in cell wall biosynthesis
MGKRGEPWRYARRWGIGISPRHLLAAARDLEVRTLILQYVPFLYARLGVSPALVKAIRRLDREGVGLAIIVHEPYVPFTRLPWVVTGLPMRRQFRAIVRCAAAVYTPVPRYAELVRRVASPRTTVRVAPVGATLPVSSETREDARSALGLPDGAVAIGVFSPGAAGFASSWIREAARLLRERAEVTWLVFGYGAARGADGLPEPARRVISESSAEAIGRVMRALDLAAAPYADGLTLRRSAAMLALAHGVPLVSSTGPLHDPDAGALAACESTPRAFAERLALLASDPVARAEVGARARRYDEVASVKVLARMIVADLLPSSPASVLSSRPSPAGES